MIYLDYGATTPVDPQVVKKMMPFFETSFGNPESKYYHLAVTAKEAVNEARKQISELINCREDEIIFTSGATEGNNFVIKGIAEEHQLKGKHIITSRIEHSSVLETCRYLEKKGWTVTYLNVRPDGRISLDELLQAIKEETVLISLAWANSEVGTLQDIDEISRAVKKKNKAIFFHCDATQVIGKIPIDLAKLLIDFLTFSSHKIHGPKGIGAVVLRRDEDGFLPDISPLIHGGEQEMGFRAGTLAVANIVGMGEAARIANSSLPKVIKQMKALLGSLMTALSGSKMEFTVNSQQTDSLDHIVSVTLHGVNNELIIRALANQLAISTGSACSSAKPSYVLEAIGIPREKVRNTIRISFGKFTTVEDLQQAVKSMEQAYLQYRAVQ